MFIINIYFTTVTMHCDELYLYARWINLLKKVFVKQILQTLKYYVINDHKNHYSLSFYVKIHIATILFKLVCKSI